MDKIKTIKVAKTPVALLVFAIALIICSAHDFYLLPDKFFLSKNDTLNVHMFVGDEFKTDEERAVERRYVKELLFITPTKRTDILNDCRDSVKPMIKKIMIEEGLGLIAVSRSKIHATIKMKPEKFTAYLREEKLDDILKLRETLPVKEEEREKYTRYIKTLVMVGNAKGEQYKERVNHALEIILLNNPYKTKLGKTVTAQLFFKDKPLYNGSVEVICRDKSGKVSVQPFKTDKDGKWNFVLEKSGEYILRITYMLPCEKCEDADWESFWASYSFGFK